MLLMSSLSGSYHHGRLAQELEDAALLLLERMPAADISLREVARAGGVSHNAPYHHFSDRMGLLRVLAERGMRELTGAVEQAVRADDSPVVQLLAAGSAYIRFSVDRPHVFNVVYDPAVCIPGSPSETMAPLIDRLEGTLNDLATAAGLGEEALALWGLIHGLGTLAAAGHFGREQGIAAFEVAVKRLCAA